MSESQGAPPPGPSPATRRTVRQALAVYLEHRSLVMLGLGFAAGLPFMLVFDTLSAWLREAGLSLQVIAFFSLATLAFSFKFLWAPLIDRVHVPLLDRRLGHRRSWMLVTQAAIVVGLLLIAGSSPAENIGYLALVAVLTSFASASQDIVIDAWRIEAVEKDDSRQGVMAAAYQWGYRIAIVVAGAVPLWLADRIGWASSYAIMAVFMAVGVVAVLLAPREKAHAVRPIPTEGLPSRPALEWLEWLGRLAVLAAAALVVGSGLRGQATFLASLLAPLIGGERAEALAVAFGQSPSGIWWQLAAVVLGFALVIAAARPLPGWKTRPGVYLFHALIAPVSDFFERFAKSASLILALICLYRLSDFVLNIMNPFYLDLGFSTSEIAEVRKFFGVIVTVVGVGLGGFSIARVGLLRSLLVGAFAGPLSNLAFVWLATRGADIPTLYVTIGIDNLAGGYAGTCLIAYMSSLTSEGFTATQYAFFSSLYSLPGKIIASQSGRIVEAAARSADGGGLFAVFGGLFRSLPPEALVEGAGKSGVSPSALGAGYVTFFTYSCALGIAAIVLTLLIVARADTTPPRGQAAEARS